MDGILNINKPSGMTSHDVVARLRRLLNEKKVGHTGTLDPDATGVLPVCLGKATRIIQFLPDEEKGYEGTITLGVTTDTLDAKGKILDTSDTSNVKLEDVKSVFNSFVGTTDQIPPMVSALKVQGQRLYKLARQGKTVERKPRKIHVYELELLDAEFPMLDFRVRCSRGTYVRVLASDIGEALGCGAHLSRLIRTKSGLFELKDSVPLEKIQTEPQNAPQLMHSIDDVLSFMPRIAVSDRARDRFLNGVPVNAGEITRCEKGFRVDSLIRIHDEAETLLGIGRATETYDPKAELNPRAVICKAVKVLK
jgi:tRNA pseudouridine55 synthase